MKLLNNNSFRCMLLACAAVGSAAQSGGQQRDLTAIREYLRDSDPNAIVAGGKAPPPDQWLVNLRTCVRTTQPAEVCFAHLMPTDRSREFVNYVLAKRPGLLLTSDEVALTADALLKSYTAKMTGSAPASSGTTSALSGIVAPAVLSAAMEYGAITQTSQGNVATLRANLLGMSRWLGGSDQFQTCIDPGTKAGDGSDGCRNNSTFWRQISASVGLETNSSGVTIQNAVSPQGGASRPATLPVSFAAGNPRMGSWGLRWDLFGRYPEGAKFAEKWKSRMAEYIQAGKGQEINAALEGFFTADPVGPIYDRWQEEAMNGLKATLNRSDGSEEVIAAQLDASLESLVQQLQAHAPDLHARLVKIVNAFATHSEQLDDFLRDLQSNKLSFEYNNLHPNGQANYSNLRLIYAYQASKTSFGGPLLTINAGGDFYDRRPGGTNTGRLRDVQAGVQADFSVRDMTGLGKGTLTLAGYYQYMKGDALLEFGSGNTTPMGGVTLPGAAVQLLGTKGHIGAFQAKYTIHPKDSLVNIPIAFTWANRTELIAKGAEKRFQVGIALDLDQILAKSAKAKTN
jgi:hypothetical protein